MRRVLAALLLLSLSVASADARIVGIDIAQKETAFGGAVFGDTGTYELLTGTAYGELDPADPRNAIVQDIGLAPRNARGMVEYSTQIQILKPSDQTRGNRVLLFEVVNRGNKLAVNAFNAGVPGGPAERNGLTSPGDGFLFSEGHTLIWFGWEMDVPAGDKRLTMAPIVARDRDGKPVAGWVRSELFTPEPTRTLPIGASWQGQAVRPISYPVANPDDRDNTLTVRTKREDAPVPVPAGTWGFGKCGDDGNIVPDPTSVCIKTGFVPGRLYELIYRARDPMVLGIGFAATRDLGAFFRDAKADSLGNANPVYRPNQVNIVEGSSQSGRMIRSMLHLGFNQIDATGRRAFDGAYPHIGGGLMPLNVRFGQPWRAWGEQVDHTYPAYDFPFSYAKQTDPLTGRTQGILDRCAASNTCPKIFHVATALEMWEGRQSLGLTDPLGMKDVPDPANVRTYIMTSTQHSPAGVPLPKGPVFGNCQQQSNPNPQIWTMRALMTSFVRWVRDNDQPPASVVPKIADGTMIPPEQVRFPAIQANTYGGVARPAISAGPRIYNQLRVYDRGPQYRPGDTSGIATLEPPVPGNATYGVLVPKTDADGNDLGGVRSVFVQVPIGTYTGWNIGRKDRFEGGMCNLQGTFVPFAATKQERLATGDHRLSLEERYPTKDAYVAAFKAAAERLVREQMLLPIDAETLVAEAQRTGIRSAP